MKKSVLLIFSLLLLAAFALSGCAGHTGPSQTAPGQSAPAQTEKANDPTALIVGRWMNDEADVITEFNEDGSYKTYQNGQLLLSDTYTVKKVNATTITLSTGSGSNMTIEFLDENTLKSDGGTMTRMTGDETSPAETTAPDASVKQCIIGKWQGGEGDVMTFDDAGKVTYVKDASTAGVTMDYAVAPQDDNTLTVTLTDVDGTTSTDTVSFTDDNTMTIGGTTYTRVMTDETASASPETEATAEPSEPINTTVDKQFDFKLGKMTLLFNDQCGTRVDSNGVLVIGRGTILIKGEDAKGGSSSSSSEKALGYVMIAPKQAKQDLKKLRDSVVNNYKNTTANFQLGEYGTEVISGVDSLTATYSYVWEDAPHEYCKNVSVKTYFLNARNNRGYIISLVFYDGATEDEYSLVYNIANSIKFYN